MVRKPKRNKQQKSARVSKRTTTIFYIISILVVISMALGLALSVLSPKGSALPPSTILLPLLVISLL